MFKLFKRAKQASGEFLKRRNIEKPLFYSVVTIAMTYAIWTFVFRDTGQYKTSVYTVTFPQGWAFDDSDSNMIVLGSREIDGLTGKPVAVISIYTKELPRAMWIEDEFPLILRDIKSRGYRVIDHGEIKLNDNLSKWILFRNDKQRLLTLHIYTIDSFNNFIQLEFSAIPERFATYRPTFEKMKDSLLLRKPLIDI